MKIKFSSLVVLGAFGSMAEGLEDNARDEHVSATGAGGAEAERFERLINTVWAQFHAGFLTFEAPDDLREAAEATRDNLFSQEHEWSGEEDEELHYRLTEADIDISKE